MINEEILFLPDETGKKCIVPELEMFFSEETLAKSDFKYFIIRQITKEGKPTGLYLRDVSKFRTPEQNSISKYKFQSLCTSEALDDKLLVKLKPGDIFDLPEYTKNQKEYACFENLSHGKAELVAVFKPKRLGEITNPIGFKMKFTKNNGEQIEIIPTFQQDSRLKFTDVQKDLDEKFNTIPDEDNYTQYLFCGNLSSVIYKNEFKNSATIIKTQDGECHNTYDFFIEVVDNVSLNNFISGREFRVNTHSQRCKVSEYFLNNSFHVENVELIFSKVFFDEECTIPVTIKHNFDSGMDYSTLYTKTEYISMTSGTCIIKSIYKYFNVKSPLKYEKGNIVCYVNEIKKAFVEKYNVDFQSFNITSLSGVIGEYLTFEQITKGDYKITFSYPRKVIIDGHSLNFDFNEDGKGYCADITSIIEQQKKENLVYHFFMQKNPGDLLCEYASTYRYILEVVQYTKDRIFLRLAKPVYSAIFPDFSLNHFETYINDIQKRKFKDNILTVYIKDQELFSGSHAMIDHYDLSCDIEAVFSGESRLYASDIYLYPEECSWYATKLNLPEIQKKYPKITQEYVTKILSAIGQMSYYECVVDSHNDFYGGYNHAGDVTDNAVNKPDYRAFFNKRDEEFYIPEYIKSQPGMPLIFTNLEYTKRYFLALYEGGLSS